LFSIINYFKPKNVLELGTSLGLGTTTIALANHDALITTVEGLKGFGLIKNIIKTLTI
jgi:predicted O-methyltransferase YrrM